MTRHSHTHTLKHFYSLTLTTTVTHLYCPDHSNNSSNHNLAKERSETPLIELKSVLSGFLAWRRRDVLLPTAAAAEPKGSYNSTTTTTTTTILPRVVADINMKVAAMIWEFVVPVPRTDRACPLPCNEWKTFTCYLVCELCFCSILLASRFLLTLMHYPHS